jgi:predicted phage tail protein
LSSLVPSSVGSGYYEAILTISGAITSNVVNNNLTVTLISKSVTDAALNVLAMSMSITITIDMIAPRATIVPVKTITNNPVIQFNVNWYDSLHHHPIHPITFSSIHPPHFG